MFLVEAESMRLLDANQSCLNFYGYSREELLQLSVTGLNPLTRDEILSRMHEEDVRGSGFYLFQHRLKGGQLREVEVRTTPVELEDGRRVYFAVAQDVSQRQRQEQKLRHSEERHRLLVENAREMVAVIQDGIFRHVNPRCQPLTGYGSQNSWAGTSFDFLTHENRQPLQARHQARLQSRTLSETYDCRIMRRDGQLVWLEISVVFIDWEEKPAVLAFLTDISQSRQAEDERVLSEHLQAAIATAGAAFDELNQPLQALLSQLELLALKLPPDRPQRQSVAVALKQAAKLAAITQRLNRITDYRTRHYLLHQHILDLEGSSSDPAQQGRGTGPIEST